MKIEAIDGVAALVIERYHRFGEHRVRQEDFSQALGASGSEKHKDSVEMVGLSRAARTLAGSPPRAELLRFALRGVVPQSAETTGCDEPASSTRQSSY